MKLEVEKIGGLAGFGSRGGHLRSRGVIEFDSLPAADQRTLERLFRAPRTRAAVAKPDECVYRIVRDGKTIEVPESAVPDAIVACVKDELG